MAKLFLHIGHGKTGSSYIQSSLAASLPILKEHGLIYPAYADIADSANGKISSGNPGQFLELINQDNPSISSDMLFSSEFFFRYLAGEKFSEIRRFIDAHFSEAHVLLFIRDPVAHASSGYLQRAKIGDTRSIEWYFDAYGAPQEVNTVLDNLETMPQVAVTIKNYASTQDVVSVVETWLGLERRALARPPVDVVNRSLTRAEFEFCRELNEQVGWTHNLFAWELCNALPDLTGDPMYPSLPVQEKLWERLASEIERVNSRVNAEERYRRDRDLHEPTPPDKALYDISREQLRVIARIAGHEIKERIASQAQLDLLKQQVAQLETRALSAEDGLSQVYRSTSWRVTEPLRALKSLAGRWFGRAR